ncbi:hypothetical protein [Largemouth bass virus]|uniref:Uncharacterized protein n=1 Tax=Largemouth bass virus TaxID=176656 RepID=A0A9X7TMB3_9VIRU|nr:hypothetical protein LMBV_038 [Largemouth bass virus]WAK75098.1 hypothetical protein [Mandarin fish ranavirus]WHA35532.1 hypothetical protein MSRaV_44L [Micropterus salmoides ranavirus]WHA35637.1 hypothetical protein SCRaV_44L [Siniperca chuatsi ranavirus]QJE49187.1 hypothetical protein LMBV_038 [Largemouth bass virus]
MHTTFLIISCLFLTAANCQSSTQAPTTPNVTVLSNETVSVNDTNQDDNLSILTNPSGDCTTTALITSISTIIVWSATLCGANKVKAKRKDATEQKQPDVELAE